MIKKFDYKFIKTKILGRVLSEWKETIQNLYSVDGVFSKDEAESVLELALSKEFKKSIKSVDRGVKEFRRQRKKLIKKGLVDVDFEKLQFMYETGIYTPLPEGPSEEPAETSETPTEQSAGGESAPETNDTAENPKKNPEEPQEETNKVEESQSKKED